MLLFLNVVLTLLLVDYYDGHIQPLVHTRGTSNNLVIPTKILTVDTQSLCNYVLFTISIL